jgi:hypothetical protein
VSEPKDKGAHDIVKSLFLLSELDMEPKSAPPKILEEKNAGQPKISEEKNAGQPKLLTDAQKFRYKADAHELRIINSWGRGVKGLAGEDIQESEESNETRVSQSNVGKAKET